MGDHDTATKRKLQEKRSLQGKVVMVTSAAQDIGYELAESLAKNGCRLVLVGDLNQTQPVSNRIKALARLSADQTKDSADIVREVELNMRAAEASIVAAVDQAWRAFGSIDVLLNCAAVPGALKSPLEMNEREWDDIMTVNLKTPWLLVKSVGQRMKQAGKRGSIIFVSSITGIERGFYPGVSVHGAAMAATHQLTKTMAMELGKYGISVMAIARGLSKESQLWASMDLEQLEKASQVVPLQRWMNPTQDLEALVILLASDYGAYSTGNVFVVDGGQSLPRPRMRAFL